MPSSQKRGIQVPLYVDYLFKDRNFSADDVFPGMDALDVVSCGCHLYGYTMLPGGAPEEKHPCVILLHGFPGHTTNHDIVQALRRMGCVVVNPFFRGAWGSEGYYTFSGLAEDAAAVANWARSEETAAAYHIDTDNIFIVGHSMGGFACVNALRRLPWVKGGVCIAPYDMPWFFENGQVDAFRALLPAGACLKQQSPQSLFEDAQACYRDLAFSQAFDDLKDRNLYFIGSTKDTTAPPADMILPLWNRLAQHPTGAIQKCEIMNSDHSFNDRRIALCTAVGAWIADVASR